MTIASTIFIVELTDKDALLLLTLATRMKPRLAFAAGSLAFTITTAIIVTVGSVLIVFLPVYWIKIAGGVIMIGFAFYEFFEISKEAKKIEKEEDQKIKQTSEKRSSWAILLSAIAMLVVLDLAGDATEVLTIVFVARFQDAALVFVACVVALVAASALETAIGNRLGKFLKPERVRYLSLFVFMIIGSIVIVATVFFP
ncbi:MAG: TMEM165/GDT1 family protein [Nitrososphaerales archaeon]